MTHRIKLSHLEHGATAINTIQGMPLDRWSPDGTNIGHYHVRKGYGGWRLEQMMNKGGGIRDVFQVGYVPKKQLHDLMRAYQAGLNDKHY